MKTIRDVFRLIRELVSETKTDIRCGRHSGFRPCCVAFFVGPWKHLMFAYAPDRVRNAYFGLIDGHYGCNVQYVCCPLCITLNRPPVEMTVCVVVRGECQPTDRKIKHSQKIVRLVKP